MYETRDEEGAGRKAVLISALEMMMIVMSHGIYLRVLMSEGFEVIFLCELGKDPSRIHSIARLL